MTDPTTKELSYRSKLPADLPTSIVVFIALGLFVVTGGSLFDPALKSIRGLGPAPEQPMVIAFLLNVALLLLGWRRSVESRRQVAARRAAELQVLELAQKDRLTGLFNRSSLAAFADAHSASGKKAAMLVIDLDHFKKVNDLHGHSAGDALLVWFGSLLRSVVSPNSCCARLSGDEFAVYLTGDDSEPARVETIARHITTKLSEPVETQVGLVHIGASIGMAAAGGDCTTEESLRRADIAMYQAKRSGRNGYAWFTTKMGEDLRRRNELEAEMREGISRREFQPYFQPQVHLASGELHGFEVLARWHHPTRGVVEPSEFIAIAEASGLIASLSLSVMRQALSIARDWYAPLTIAINISPVQLKDPLLDQKIAKLLVETGFPAQRLELEITESSLFDDMELALTTIESLKNLGVKLSLDDFGTGYSSLTQLQALPFDRIKIDRSFVMTMNENGESAAIVNAILHLARSLKLPVTAEGIETSAIQGALSELGCADGQGWLYGKALPAQLIEERLPVRDRERTDLAIVGSVSEIGQIGSQLHERRDLQRRGTGRKVEKQSARA